jgi:hypothetical protein
MTSRNSYLVHPEYIARSLFRVGAHSSTRSILCGGAGFRLSILNICFQHVIAASAPLRWRSICASDHPALEAELVR